MLDAGKSEITTQQRAATVHLDRFWGVNDVQGMKGRAKSGEFYRTR